MTPLSNLHSDLPAVDRSKLEELKLLGPPGETKLYVTLLEMFFRLAPPLYQQLLDALESGDTSAVKKHAHKLAGSCGSYAGMRATRICLDMQHTEADIDAARAMRPSLEESFTELCGQLQQELNSFSLS